MMENIYARVTFLSSQYCSYMDINENHLSFLSKSVESHPEIVGKIWNKMKSL